MRDEIPEPLTPTPQTKPPTPDTSEAVSLDGHQGLKKLSEQGKPESRRHGLTGSRKR